MVAVAVYSGVCLAVIVFVLHFSLVIGVLYMMGMYHFQRFEFKRHRCRVGMMVYILVDSFMVLCFFCYFILQI